MWQTLNDAAVAMGRDGWKRYTGQLWYKRAGGRTIWAELEWCGGGYVPVMQDDEDTADTQWEQYGAEVSHDA
jgi:hypothetical protein